MKVLNEGNAAQLRRRFDADVSDASGGSARRTYVHPTSPIDAPHTIIGLFGRGRGRELARAVLDSRQLVRYGYVAETVRMREDAPGCRMSVERAVQCILQSACEPLVVVEAAEGSRRLGAAAMSAQALCQPPQQFAQVARVAISDERTSFCGDTRISLGALVAAVLELYVVPTSTSAHHRRAAALAATLADVMGSHLSGRGTTRRRVIRRDAS